MKTNPFARGVLRIRAFVLCLAIVGLAAVEVELCESLSSRFGQYTAAQNQVTQAPRLSLGDVMGAAPVVR
jgi:hypothetical protein